MDISPNSARETLDDIDRIMRDTRAAVANSGTGEILMLWGIIWCVSFAGSHFWREQAGWGWLAGGLIGVVGTFLMATGRGRHQKVRSPATRRLGWRVFWFWCALSCYSWLWVFLLQPLSGLQLSAFLITLVMLAYIVLGLWFESNFLIFVAVGVTAATAAGYWLWPAYYSLWMAVAGGGALFGSGLYMRLRWR